MTDGALESLVHRGVAAGIISRDQGDALLQLAAGDGGTPPLGGEARRGLNVVTVAYLLGALLIAFSCGWFLIDRWARLGPLGVLAVVLAYAGVLVIGARWLSANRFPFAAGVLAALAVSLTPLVAWSFLALSGRWPLPATRDPLLRDSAWMSWQWIILELSTILVALLVIRRSRIATLAYPLALALWGMWYHAGQLLRWGGEGGVAYGRWMSLAGGLVLLAVADQVERWQRRAAPPHDWAGAFWLVGFVAFSVGYLGVWTRAEGWRHLLPFVALGVITLALYLRRRVVLLFGLVGVFGYLAFVADDVFRDFISFPILIALFGVLLILATVWMQRRFPALVARIDARRGGEGAALPWSSAMGSIFAAAALAVALLSRDTMDEERRQSDFRQRLYILRRHSGSLRRPGDEGGGASRRPPPVREAPPTANAGAPRETSPVPPP